MVDNKAPQRRVGVSEMNIEPRRHPLERSAGGMPHRGGCVSSGGKTKSHPLKIVREMRLELTQVLPH